MSRVCAIAVGAVSALGIGEAAYAAAREGEPARVALDRDATLAAAGLARPIAGRAPADLGAPSCGDRATDLLACAWRQLDRDLDRVQPGWRSQRIGLAIGTSSGGMLSAERFFAARAARAARAAQADSERIEPVLARAATYFAPFDGLVEQAALGPALVQRTQVLAACAASTIAIGVATRWLQRGACDLVIAGGYDGVSVFVASGFEALRATTASTVRPFRVGRDGMALGEGAALVALVRDDGPRSVPARFWIGGFGASTDAVHITAPDRTGGGLARAAEAAIGDAACAPARIGLVSAHATATAYNDAMEARALDRALGLGEGEARASAGADARPVVHPFKAQIGHTLGAAGVLETLAAAHALDTGVAPAAAGEGEADADASVRLLARGERMPLEAALKLSAAFGGANAALVVTRSAPATPRVARAARPIAVRGWAHVGDADLGALSAATGVARDRLARLDGLCRLGLGAVCALADQVGRERLAGAAVVAGHALATLDTNATFDERKRIKGARAVEPRLFPATSPNAIAGECAIVFGMTGPSFAVSAGLDGGMEALARGIELCAAGDAERVVVIAADELGPASRDLIEAAGWTDRPVERGAVALLLEPAGAGEVAPACALDPPVDHRAGPIGHLSLLGWLRRGRNS